jgi:cyanate lyase
MTTPAHRKSAMNEAKNALGQKILAAKRKLGLSWQQIADQLGYSPVWICAACLGQMSMSQETAQRCAALFGLDEDDSVVLQTPPYRGSIPNAVSTDPLIYRFQELVAVYATTWKELIQEEFGDGIMSAIDFDMAIERQHDDKGDRVRLTMSGKFLPYKRY